MYIEELKEGDSDDKDEEEETVLDVSHGEIRLSDAKRALIVVGSRFLFYPTLLYNVIRNKIQSEFHWWDLIDEVLQFHCILLLRTACLFAIKSLFFYSKMHLRRLQATPTAHLLCRTWFLDC